MLSRTSIEVKSAVKSPLIKRRSTAGVSPGYYVSSATPESDIVADRGSICTDMVSGKIYLKTVGSTATGWKELGLKDENGLVKVGTAWIGGDQTGNTRGTGSIDVQASRSSTTQVASGTGSICVGLGCTASGANSRSIGSFVTVTSDNTIEVGMWSSNSRACAVRMHASTGQVAFTIPTRPIPFTDAGATAGGELTNTLGRSMGGIRWSGSGLYIDYNDNGTIVTREIGGGAVLEEPAGPAAM